MADARRVAVLGLDGLPHSLLVSLCAQGVMPNLARLAESGTLVPMESTQPPVSSVAWTSFMTGRNPGEHGIFGFTDLHDDRISLRLPSFDDVKCPALWQTLGDRGKTSTVVNLPFTYPARPLRGVLIAGFVAPTLERAVYPESLLPWLRSMDYRVDVDAAAGRKDRRGLITDLFHTLNVHEQVMLSLMESRPWDLFIGVITGTDRLHHFFFDAAYDETHPFHGDFKEYYRRVDTCVGRFTSKLGNDTRLVVLSDHGFTGLKTQVYVNNMLQDLGYLRFAGHSGGRLEEMDPRSVAFAMDPSRIYLCRRSRFPQGRVLPAEEERTLAKLTHDLERVTLADAGVGEPPDSDHASDRLFEKVLTKEEIYSGRCMDKAPDLVLVPRRGYDLKATLGVPRTSMRDIFTGTHTHDDAFLLVNESGLGPNLQGMRIDRVAALVLETLP
ncbi:MAG: alkaline phosphatase family protein [Thermodesulfobacteriota bacterium]